MKAWFVIVAAVAGMGCLSSSYSVTTTSRGAQDVVSDLMHHAESHGLAARARSDGWVWFRAKDRAWAGAVEVVEHGEEETRILARDFASSPPRSSGGRSQPDEDVPVDAAPTANEVVSSLYGPGRVYELEADEREVVWMDDVVLEALASAGAMGTVHGATWRFDATLRGGPRLERWGGGRDDAEPSTRLSLLGGIGYSQSESVSWLRPELVLSLDRQETVEAVPGLVLPQSGRLVVDLTVAALVDAAGDHHGGEVGVALRHGLVGGIYARAGLIAFDRRPLFTWHLGLTLGTYPTLVAGVYALLAAALIAGAAQAAGDGLRSLSDG
jgi:hypothetical protein